MPYIFHCCLPIVVIISCCSCSQYQTWFSFTTFSHMFILFLQCWALIVTLCLWHGCSFICPSPPSLFHFLSLTFSIVRLYGRVTIIHTHLFIISTCFHYTCPIESYTYALHYHPPFPKPSYNQVATALFGHRQEIRKCFWDPIQRVVVVIPSIALKLMWLLQ